jgi:hypothetical protein
MRLCVDVDVPLAGGKFLRLFGGERRSSLHRRLDWTPLGAEPDHRRAVPQLSGSLPRRGARTYHAQLADIRAYPTPRAMGSSDKLSVECDFGFEDLGDRAVLLGVFGHLGEFGFFEIRHVRAQS